MKKFVSILLLSSVFCMHAMQRGSNPDDILRTIRESVDTEENIDLEQREKDVPEINAAVYELQPSMPGKTTKQKRGELRQHLQGSVDVLERERGNPADGPALIIDFFNVDAGYFKQKTNISVAEFLADLTDKEIDTYYADYKKKRRGPVASKPDSTKFPYVADDNSPKWKPSKEILDLLAGGIGFDSKS